VPSARTGTRSKDLVVALRFFQRIPRVRTCVTIGAAALLVSGIAAVGWRAWRGGSKEDRSIQKSTAGAKSGDASKALRARARQALARGELAGAFGLYRSLDVTEWTADDACSLGSELVRQNRVALGWSALEAARRIEPKHAETVHALEAIQARLATAAGPERERLRDAAQRVESLRAINGGPPLALFVLGLASFTKDSDDDVFLDRIALHDRALVRAVNSPASAIGLLGRLLMEAGRAPEAHDLIAPILTERSSAGESSQHEAAWLLSRAALQLDRHKEADEMLALAGDFGRSQRQRPEPSPYVGSKACNECHGKIFHEQQDASRHATTLRLGSALKDVPLPARPLTDPMSPDVVHAFVRKGDDRIEMESRKGSDVVRAVVEYAVGSGRHGITMVAQDETGAHRELRISYFAEGASWGETKGIDGPPGGGAELIGLPLAPNRLQHCLSCHTTWLRSIDVSGLGARGPDADDRGIGCERCHGPGLNHVKAVRSGYAEIAIALGSKAPPSARLKSCVECHAADGSVSPSDPEFTRAQGTTFLFSRCVTATTEQFSCTTCHDPHRPIETAAAAYEAKCLSCHGANSAKAAHRSSAPAPDEKPIPPCPVNPAAQCVSCHMPKVDDRSRRSQFTDHHIRIHRPPAPKQAHSSPALLEKPQSAMIERKSN
jgi:hypothetical protein